MSDLQRQILDNFLQGAAKQMQGFNLGVPYGGANTRSYTPQAFQFGTGTPTYAQDPINSVDKDKLKDPNKDADKDKIKDPNKPPEKRPLPGPIHPKTSALATPGASSWISPWASIFNNLPKPNMPSMPQDQALTQLLTSAFARPYTQAMTGNYPKY
jgi:hypothetical protein